jgi:hypothetical protein
MNIGFLHLFVVEEVWVNGRTLARKCVRPAWQISNARGQPYKGSAMRRVSPARERRSQVARGFFLDFRDLALTGFRECAGLMLTGRPTATGVTSASGSGLN